MLCTRRRRRPKLSTSPRSTPQMERPCARRARVCTGAADLPSDDGKSAAPVQTLARRAQGRSIWGVLRGDVDNFGLRLRRVHSIEEHVPLSVLYKQFFAGELEVLCSLPEFWRKVSIIYSGGDDFAVYGSWDALIALAREMQRLFHRFTEENLKDYPGAEGKTISMAIALAPETYHPLAFARSRWRPASSYTEASGWYVSGASAMAIEMVLPSAPG